MQIRLRGFATWWNKNTSGILAETSVFSKELQDFHERQPDVEKISISIFYIYISVSRLQGEVDSGVKRGSRVKKKTTKTISHIALKKCLDK